ncbi:MAG TPA: hypothetical protein VFT21_04370 [Gemmatimonadaceae bacterium]|nr:hypothetical protein [Gemmatimonadaceae bacterium]
MQPIPETRDAPVLRTDFSDQGAWDDVCGEIRQPVDGFLAYVAFIDDPQYAGISIDELLRIIPANPGHGYIFVVDQVTISVPEHPVLVVDLVTDRGRAFRALPSMVQSIENNLSIANMDFAEFADSVDETGVFRGFPTF